MKLYHLSGLGSVYDLLEQCRVVKNLISPDVTVDFKNIGRVFSDQPYLYELGIIYASFVGHSRKYNLLL